MGRYEIDGFEIYYEQSDSIATITGYEGRGSNLTVPSQIVGDDGKTVVFTAVGKKAFLGCKGLKTVVLPESIMTIEDWAFSKCIHLSQIVIPSFLDNDFTLGRRVFEGCNNLLNICREKDKYDDLSYICAASVAKLPAEYLLWDEDLGSKAWYKKWDLALTNYIALRDHEGYTDTVLCGEEDISYDGIPSVDGELLGETYEYVKGVSKGKCYLCFLRCIHKENIEQEAYDAYRRYIYEHRKGVSNETAWLLLVEDCKDDIEYYEVYTDIVGTDTDTIEDMLMSIGPTKTLVKAYLISLCNQKKEDDIFDSLLL